METTCLHCYLVSHPDLKKQIREISVFKKSNTGILRIQKIKYGNPPHLENQMRHVLVFNTRRKYAPRLVASLCSHQEAKWTLTHPHLLSQLGLLPIDSRGVVRSSLSRPQSSGSTKVSKESTVPSWMLFRDLSQPPHPPQGGALGDSRGFSEVSRRGHGEEREFPGKRVEASREEGGRFPGRGWEIPGKRVGEVVG